MKPLFIKKNGTVSKVSGIVMNLIPSYTLAEYNALTHKPLFWVRTDEEYAQISSEDVSYGNSTVKEELDEINADIHKGYVEIIGDGVKTRSQILDELYALADKTKITEQSVLDFNLRAYHFMSNYSGTYFFGSVQCSSSNMQCYQCQMKSSGSIVEYVQSEVGGSTTYDNISTPASASGRSYRLYY